MGEIWIVSIYKYQTYFISMFAFWYFYHKLSCFDKINFFFKWGPRYPISKTHPMGINNKGQWRHLTMHPIWYVVWPNHFYQTNKMNYQNGRLWSFKWGRHIMKLNIVDNKENKRNCFNDPAWTTTTRRVLGGWGGG